MRDNGRRGALDRARLPKHARVQHDDAQRHQGDSKEVPRRHSEAGRRLSDQRPVAVRGASARHRGGDSDILPGPVRGLRGKHRQYLRHRRLAGRQERARLLRGGHILPHLQAVRRRRAQRAGVRHVPLERAGAGYGADGYRGAGGGQRGRHQARGGAARRVQAGRHVRAVAGDTGPLRGSDAPRHKRPARRRILQRGLHRRRGHPAQDRGKGSRKGRRDRSGLRRLVAAGGLGGASTAPSSTAPATRCTLWPACSLPTCP